MTKNRNKYRYYHKMAAWGNKEEDLARMSLSRVWFLTRNHEWELTTN